VPSQQKLQVEKHISYAHRALLRAAYLAESFSVQSTADDLHQLAEETRRVQEALLKGSRGLKTSPGGRT
jgi:hypothetical protein